MSKADEKDVLVSGKEKNTTEPQLKSSQVKYGDYNAEILRDYDGKVDPFYLSKKDPDFEYRFLREERKNLNLKTSNLLLQKGGWQICPKQHLLRIGLKESEISADGMYRVGDQILAFIPKKLFDEKEKYKREQTNNPMNMINRLLKKGDSSVGRDIHNSMRGLQTEKALK